MDAGLAKKRERWYAFPGVDPMLKSIGTPLPARLRRLFCVACCRRVWHLMPDDESRAHVEAAEADAEREVAKEEQDAHWARVTATTKQSLLPWARTAAVCARIGGCGGTSGAVAMAVTDAGGNRWDEERVQADLLRDIVGEWFDPVMFLSEWRSSQAVALAAAMYRDREFDRMPELGDFLAATGCAEPRVLDHCRSPGLHVRGCWVVDGVLGRRTAAEPGAAPGPVA